MAAYAVRCGPGIVLRQRGPSDPGRTKPTALASPGLGKLGDHREARPRDPGEDQLGDAVAGIDQDAFFRAVRLRRVAVARRNETRSLVIGVDQADCVAESEPLAIAEPRARQYQRTRCRLADTEGDASRDQHSRSLRAQPPRR